MNPFELIDRYLDEDLTEEETLFFEAETRKNPALQQAFQEAYRFRKQLKRTMIRQVFEEEIAPLIGAETRQSLSSTQHQNMFQKTPWLWIPSIAAVIVILLAVYFRPQMISPEYSKVVENYDLSFDGSDSFSQQYGPLRKKAWNNLVSEKYDLAEQYFQELRYFSAIDTTTKVGYNTYLFLQKEAQYGLFVSAFKQKEYVLANEQLVALSQNGNDEFAIKAQKLIRTQRLTFWLIISAGLLLFVLPASWARFRMQI